VELKLFYHPLSSTTFTVNTRFLACSEPTVLKMVEDRCAMYYGFSDKGAHSAEWFDVAKNFLKLAFPSDRREVKWSCNRCQNRRMLSKYEMSGHIVCTNMERCRQPHALSRMDLGSWYRHPPSEVQNFYRLLARWHRVDHTPCCSGRSTRMILNVCIAVGPDTWKW
jgi:hypothetical protein